MGSKVQSRALMDAAGVPIVPGVTEPVADVEAARPIAERIGYPVAVKASAGGGGKGFRVALDADELEGAFLGASGEGLRFFADGEVYLERYLPDPRHVEIQILADTQGSCVWLGERDCSVQRRHQKLIEETPPARSCPTTCAPAWARPRCGRRRPSATPRPARWSTWSPARSSSSSR